MKDIFHSESELVFSDDDIKLIREHLILSLKNCFSVVRFDDIPSEILDKVLFDYSNVLGVVSKKFALPFDTLERIDMSNVSFDNFLCCDFNFCGLECVSIDPMNVPKTFSNVSFWGVEFTSPIVDHVIEDVDFSGSKNAVIDPVKNKISYGNKFRNVRFTWPFKDPRSVQGNDFSGSRNAVIDLRSIYILSGANLNGAMLIGSLNGHFINGASFAGAYTSDDEPILINPNKAGGNRLNNCNFGGVSFTEPVNCEINISGSDFTGSKGMVLDPKFVPFHNFRGCKFADVKFVNSYLLGGFMTDCDFTGSKGAVIDFDIMASYKGCNFTDARFAPGITKDNVLDFIYDPEMVTYNGQSFTQYLEKYDEASNSSVSKIYQKIDKAIAKEK